MNTMSITTIPDSFTDVELPALPDSTTAALHNITSALGVPREILASSNDIEGAWRDLPELLNAIPDALRSEEHARMCVAVAAGLFDAAINYIWNSAVIELRNKVVRFGLDRVGQITGKQLDDADLSDMKDSDLLNLCLELNLLSVEAYFFLSQCRDIRNNFSSAHPPLGRVDKHEFMVFVSRCVKFALNATSNPIGVDVSQLISSLKASRFNDEQKREWVDRIAKTHDAQRKLIFSTLHGIYCDPDSSEESRRNSIDLCSADIHMMTPIVRSELLNRHSDYVAKGLTDRARTSQEYFQHLGILSLLSSSEQHAIFSTACSRLMTMHTGYNNFYNEAPFAERLLELSEQVGVPQSCQDEFVTVVVTCAVGNEYGVSRAAIEMYKAMISNFSPKEVDIMIDLYKSLTLVGNRIRSHNTCRKTYTTILRQWIDTGTVQTKSRAEYDRILSLS